MRRARFRVLVPLTLIILLLTLWLARPLWLPLVGHALIHDDGPAPADIAIVLGGDSWGQRITTASELVRAGYVPKVMVSGPPYYDLHESDSEIGYAYHHGYPLEWFVAFPNDANSTREEAWAIVPELRRLGIRKFLLVTSSFHTARAGRIFRSVIRATGSVLEMRMVAAPDHFFKPDSWWQHREAQQVVFIEWSKTIATFLGPLTMLESLSTLRKYLWRYRWGMAVGLGCLVIKDVAQAGQPLLIRDIIDALTRLVRGSSPAVHNPPSFLWYVAGLAGLAVLKAIFQYWMRVIIIGISRDVEYDIRNDLFRHLIGLSPDYYGETRTGDIMARATNDLNAVRMMLGPAVMYCVETGLTFILAILIMVSVDWRLALLAIAPAPVVSLVVMVSGRAIHTRFERIQAIFSDISSRVQENLSGVRMIRAFAQESAEMRRFEELNRHYIAQNLKLVRIDAIFQPLMEVLIGLTFLVVLWVGGHQVLLGRLSIGGFVMFNTFMGTLVWPMIALGWVVNLMQRGTASLGRINQILRTTPTIKPPQHPVPLPDPQGRIGFHAVSVDYGAGAVLSAIDLEIPAGATIAIVGHTGSGKSTLVNLVPRLMDPTAGALTLDGIDLRDLDPADLRRHIGFVPQETFLFSATIAENIAFGVDTATPAEIRRAAEIAGLAGDIEGFPAGYETMVGERGITLSGGQKQRTAIARAILRNPRILILDDALSSVDTLTEERILTQLADEMRGRTVILISHRVSTVRQAGLIVVLEKGRIVEQGTHAELIESGGYYADLSQKQMLEEELEAI